MAKRKTDAGYRVAVSGARRLVALLLLILVVILIIFAGRTAYRFGYSVFHQVPVSDPPGENITVVIPEHASVKEIGNILQNAGLIKDVALFRVQERLSAYHKTITAEDFQGGSFRMNTSLTTDELLAIIAGETTEVQTVTESTETKQDVKDPNAEQKLIEGVSGDGGQN